MQGEAPYHLNYLTCVIQGRPRDDWKRLSTCPPLAIGPCCRSFFHSSVAVVLWSWLRWRLGPLVVRNQITVESRTPETWLDGREAPQMSLSFTSSVIYFSFQKKTSSTFNSNGNLHRRFCYTKIFTWIPCKLVIPSHNSVTFNFMKNSFSDISRKCILPKND